jgi:hypothetical protein
LPGQKSLAAVLYATRKISPLFIRCRFFGGKKVMKTENAFSLIAVGSEDQDDINALSDAFSLKAFRYIDIAREARLQQLLSRWPLLQECTQGPESPR